jgi:2-iminobutanoate/2-iminopropanoate deaminase
MTEHRAIQVPTAARPKGPYSPAVAFDRLLFVSGQGARVPETDLLSGPDVRSQTEQCLRNVVAILNGVFLTDMNDFEEMNAVYARMFGDHRPARTTVAVSALPTAGLRVEIDCIAYVP